MKQYLLSVDGGGTKTALCLCDLSGAMLHTTKVGAGSYKSVGLDKAHKNIEKGINKICKTAGITVNDIVYSVWGISGCDAKDDFTLMENIIEAMGFEKGNYTLLNDALLAYYAAAEGQGMALIAGTGSIVFGINEKGETCRTGGWGYNFSDLGSGQWLGNEALKEVLMYCDGCIAYRPWFEDVREYFGVAEFSSLPYITSGILDYSTIAGLSAVLFSAGDDILAHSILKRGAGYLASMMAANYDKISPDKQQKFSIALFGGCLEQECYREILLASLPDALKSNHITFIIPQISTAEGGLRFARKIYLQKTHKGKGAV